MPAASSEPLAQSQPPTNDVKTSKADLARQSYSQNEKEPLANHGAKHKPGITFAAQDNLAKLPIPELDTTLKKYVDVLKPLQTLREQEDTAAAVQDFLKSDGPELQARLRKYATGKTSYIEQFCMYFHQGLQRVKTIIDAQS